mmetsp:Transcript_42690/g.31222  ORF Transcript_42690/g.31222 Transcript_42690/m.31222 type:complete len:91 (+) Transcript_42690:95-367(+)
MMKMVLSSTESSLFYLNRESEPFAKKLKTEFQKAVHDLGKDASQTLNGNDFKHSVLDRYYSVMLNDSEKQLLTLYLTQEFSDKIRLPALL